MAIEHIYNGSKAVTLPSSDRISSSLEGMNSLIREADKIKFSAFKENEKWFTDATNVDVESYLSSANAQAQQTLLDKYNTEAAGILKAVKGDFSKLSGEQKMALQRGRTALEAEQKKMKADMERYLLEKRMVESKPMDYDVEEWNETIASEYLKNGKMPESPIPYRRQPISAWLNTNKIRGANPPQTIIKPVAGNPNKEVAYEVSATIDDVAPVIVGKVYSDPRIMRDAEEAFKELSESEKSNYLNGTNIDPHWSNPKLKEITNPVLRNYIDKNWEAGVQTSAGNPTFRERGTGGGGFNWNIGIGAGNNQNNQFDKQSNITLGKVTFDNFYNLGQKSFTSDPQMIQSYTDLNTGVEKVLNKATRFEVVGYSPDKDMLIVKTVDRVTGLPEGRQIGLKGSLYSDLLKKKPFGIYREELVKNVGTKTTKGPLY
jgi:hypothetical protein